MRIRLSRLRPTASATATLAALLALLACSDTGGAEGGATGGIGAGAAGAGADAGASGGSTSSTSSTGGTSGNAGGTSATLGGGAAGTFYVDGRFLYDRCGEKVILRGVNEMIVWSSGQDGVPEFAEIAKTGANAVRIVWNDEGSAAQLDAAISNAIDEKLIPIVEHHGATGELDLVAEVVDYWTQDDVVATLDKHAAYLLLNIANEAGDDSVSQSDFESTYKDAITRIRNAGLTMPLVIDASTWGQEIDMLQAAGPTLLAHDPEQNLLFSVHMWWSDASGDRVRTEVQESVDMGLPLIVGEFAQHAVYQCDQNPFAYEVLLDEAEKHEIGWLAWSWGGVDNSDCSDAGSFDMTTNGTFGNWETTWGEEVAVTDPNSIQNTSVRPSSITSGACN